MEKKWGSGLWSGRDCGFDWKIIPGGRFCKITIARDADTWERIFDFHLAHFTRLVYCLETRKWITDLPKDASGHYKVWCIPGKILTLSVPIDDGKKGRLRFSLPKRAPPSWTAPNCSGFAQCIEVLFRAMSMC